MEKEEEKYKYGIITDPVIVKIWEKFIKDKED